MPATAFKAMPSVINMLRRETFFWGAWLGAGISGS
jgi:hypothetical protein